MQLFSAAEIKSSKESELARDLLRTKSIKEALDKVRTELNEANASFDLALANQRVIWSKESEEASEKLKGLLKEIDEAQKTRDRLIIPIDLDRQKADNMIKEANDLLVEVNNKKKDVEELSDILEKRLDEVSERDEELGNRERRILSQEKGISDQQKVIKETTDNITGQLQLLTKELQQKEKELNERKITLDLQETNNNHLLETIQEKEQEIIKDKELIKSQRQALKAALQEHKHGK